MPAALAARVHRRRTSAGGGSPDVSFEPSTSTSSIVFSGAADGGPAAFGRLRRDLRASRRVTLGMYVVGLDDSLNQLVANHVLAAEADELDPLDRLQHLAHDYQPGALLVREVHLGDVPRHHHPRAEPKPRQEHLHLLRGRVLRLVEDHEGVVERAPAHERQRGDLDHAALYVLGDLLGIEHVVQGVEERSQVRVDLGHQVARQEAQALAGLDGWPGEDDAVDLVAGERGGGHRYGKEGLAGAGRPDAEGDRVRAHRVHVALLVDRLGRYAQAAVCPNDVLEHPRWGFLGVQRARDRGDRSRSDLMTAVDQVGELAHDPLAGVRLCLVTVECQKVATQEHLAVQMRLQSAKDDVLTARQLGGDDV